MRPKKKNMWAHGRPLVNGSVRLSLSATTI